MIKTTNFTYLVQFWSIWNQFEHFFQCWKHKFNSALIRTTFWENNKIEWYDSYHTGIILSLKIITIFDYSKPVRKNIWFVQSSHLSKRGYNLLIPAVYGCINIIRLNLEIWRIFDPRKLSLNLNSSDFRVSKMIWNDTKLTPIFWELNIENTLLSICVGVWVGGPPRQTFQTEFQNRILRELDQKFYISRIGMIHWISFSFWNKLSILT